LLLAAAAGLRKLGAQIVCIAEQAPFSRVANFALHLYAHPDKLCQALGLKLRLLAVPYRCGVWPVRAEGDDHVQRVTLTDGRRTWTEACDLLACGFGLTPNVELPLALGCELDNGFVRVDAWQTTSLSHVYCAGEPTGLGAADCALVEGQIAGYAAAGQSAKAEALFPERARWHRFRARLASSFAVRPELKSLATDDTLFCRCEDVTFKTVRQFGSWREAKLHSRCGMGPCQGRVCGAAARFVFGWSVNSVRPPVLPVRVASLISESTCAFLRTSP
jgi:NADPH-dependent 2,4-dienoyl-CoA reductase/sulfur reductase-like enzyme